MAAQREHTAPCAGDYLHDSTRLVEVLGIDREGNYECEDCKDEGAIVYVPVQQVGSVWKVIVRG